MPTNDQERKPGRPPKYSTEEERKQAIADSVKRAKKKYHTKNMTLLREYKRLQQNAAAVGIIIGSYPQPCNA